MTEPGLNSRIDCPIRRFSRPSPNRYHSQTPPDATPVERNLDSGRAQWAVDQRWNDLPRTFHEEPDLYPATARRRPGPGQEQQEVIRMLRKEQELRRFLSFLAFVAATH